MPDTTTVGPEDGGEYEFGSRCLSCFAELPPVPEDEDRTTIVCPSCGQSFLAIRARPK